MQVERVERSDRTALGLGVLLVGIAIGALWPRPDPKPIPAAITGGIDSHFVAGTETNAITADLPTLALTVTDAAARRLTSVRERALDKGLIVQGEDDLVPAQIALGDGSAQAASIRIKGDWTDHVAGDRWSFRVELSDGQLLGMRVFSIQDPATRGHLWEWLVHRAMQRVGVLAPRGTFVNVAINGNAWGVYYLEEHFSKELLESQGRREGPIVLWDESALWNTQLQAHHLLPTGVALALPRSLAPTPHSGAMGVTESFPRAYGEKRLGSIESLANALEQALGKLTSLSDLVLAEDPAATGLRRLEAIERLQGQTVERLVNLDTLANHHAVASLFQLEHSLAWHNMRFYYDAVRDRVEPISFDNMAHEPGLRDPVPVRSRDVAAVFGTSAQYVAQTYAALADIATPGWLGALFADTREELERFEAALGLQSPLSAGDTIAGMEERLIRQAGWLQSVLDPNDPLQTTAHYEITETPAGGASIVTGTAQVDAWASIRTPVIVEAIRFSNGNTIPAAEIAPEGAVRQGTGVLLPIDGRRVSFSFELDHRLANLSNLSALLRSVQANEATRELDLGIEILWRSAGNDRVTSELLRMRRRDPGTDTPNGRPQAPTVAETLTRHPFLRYSVDRHNFRAEPGVWDVVGDLVLPTGATLDLVAGTTLRFEAHALLLSEGALRFRGTADAPVVLEPQPDADRFRGVVVLDAKDRSEWQHTIVRKTDAVARGGWRTTGGVTFYHSSVSLRETTFLATFAEDGLNLFGTDIELTNCSFDGCASDSLDGDFVTGRLVNCRFVNGAADGADFSGSDVELEGCVFLDLADKGISVGEDSVVRVVGGRAERVAIGIASKDRSRAIVRNFDIRDARLFGLAAFVKKAEFGPSQIFAENVRVEGDSPTPFVAQTGCKLVVDGETIETRTLDVEALYSGANNGL